MIHFITKKLVYEARDVIPLNLNILDQEYPVTVEGGNGGGLWNIGIIKKPATKCRLKSMTVSLAENHSSVGKNVRPIVGFSLHVASLPNLSFLKELPEAKFAETGLKIDETSILSHSQCDSINMGYQFNDQYPTNIISFSSDIDRNLIFLPRFYKGLPSVFQKLQKFKTISFQDIFVSNESIDIPDDGDYLIITPYATAPIPTYFYVSSAGTISVALNFNAELEAV